MYKSVVAAAIFAICVSLSLANDMHPIRPKPDQCFATYKENRPIQIKNLNSICVSKLPKHKSCVGLQLKTDETILVKCNTKMGKQIKLDEGCYRYLREDNQEEVVCQKYDEGRKCEVLSLPNGENIDVHCTPLKPSGIIVIRQSTPKTS